MAASPWVEPPRSVAVFRALMLGDMLCLTPALRALRHGWPQARITLVGLPWAEEWALRLPTVDAFETFPGWPGLPERSTPGRAQVQAFVERQCQQRYDLALQMHGSGQLTNALVAAFGAEHSAGFAAASAWVPRADAAWYLRWPEHGSEVERLLALTGHLGLAPHGLGLDFVVDDADRAAARALQPARPYAIVHPGSQWRSRRWPAERFAAVADLLVARGLAVLVTGSAAEAALTAQLRACMRQPATDLAGRTSLGALGALVEGAALVLCNDTGVSHVAAAFGTPSVVVACGSDVQRWAPADRQRHRVLWHDIACRPCAEEQCPVREPVPHPCAQAVEVSAVAAAALAQLAH
jgi:ADP-heptose:LPS heptosyltransferase